MKSNLLVKGLFTVLFFTGSPTLFAQSPGVPKWSTSGNTIGAGNGRLGSLDNQPVKIITNNITRIYIDSTTGNVGINTNSPTDQFYVKGNQVLAGNLSFTNGNQAIQFGSPNGSNTAMMYMFPSGTNNAARMVIGHSPFYPTYGLRYTDASDQWDFVYNGTSTFSINGASASALYKFSAKSLNISDTALIATRLGVGGPGSTNYTLNVNASSTVGGINITDAYDNYSLYSVKSGSNQGIFIGKSSTLSSTPCIDGQSTGSSDGVWGISNTGAGVYGKSSNASGVIGYTSNSSAWGGYFTGNVYTSGVYQASDERLKKNIKTMDNAMDIINQLQPKSYEFKDDGDYGRLNLPKGNHFGLLAGDVEKIIPGIVKDASINTRYLSAEDPKEGDKGKMVEFKAVNYTELIPVIVKGMQEQQSTIQQQNKTIADMQNEIDQLKSLIQSKSIASANEINGSSAKSSLEQNIPNPFNSSSTIRYNVPANASIQILSKSGSVIKTYSVQKGSGQITINSRGLSSGTYTYRLLVNGKITDSKQLVLTK